MLKLAIEDARAHLDGAIELAHRLERLTQSKRPTRRVDYVGYGLLVRNRRLAEAVRQLDAGWSYEGRMLLRSMIEIYINYAWMRLAKPHSRATRYLRFETLEELRLLPDVRGSMSEDAFATTKASLLKRRRRLRHLFRKRDSHGRLYWAKDWADGTSFQARLQQVLKSQGQHDPEGDFMYGLYRWTSSAVHGGPRSVAEVLDPQGLWPKPADQPEEDPAAAMSSAMLTLLVHVGVLANDVGKADALDPELTSLVEVVKGWMPARSG